MKSSFCAHGDFRCNCLVLAIEVYTFASFYIYFTSSHILLCCVRCVYLYGMCLYIVHVLCAVYKRPKLIQFSSLVKFLLNLLRHKYSRRLSELVSNTPNAFFMYSNMCVWAHVYASHSHRCACNLLEIDVHSTGNGLTFIMYHTESEGKGEGERDVGWVYSLMMTQHWTVRHFNYRYTLSCSPTYNVCSSHS